MRTPWMFLGALVVAGLLGCDEATIRSYQAPKEPPPGPSVQAENAYDQTAPTADQQARMVDWDVPANWQPADSDEPMRLATFHAGSDEQALEVVVTAMPGEAGGLRANLNRWRELINLPPLAPDDELPIAERIEADRLRGVVFDIANESPGPAGSSQRTLVAVLQGPQRSWFIRATDQPQRVQQHREAVLAFARSFRLRAGETDHAPLDDTPGPELRAIRWTLPEDWAPESSRSELQGAAFRSEQGTGDVRILVTPTNGRGGEMLTALNRWRDQVGLEPASSLEQQPHERIQIAGETALWFDLTGTAYGSPQRLVVVAQPPDNAGWVFKMTGPPRSVAETEQAFRKFLNSVSFDEGGP